MTGGLLPLKGWSAVKLVSVGEPDYVGLMEITIPVYLMQKKKKDRKAKLRKHWGEMQLNRRKAKACSAFALTWFQLIRLLYTTNITSTLYL